MLVPDFKYGADAFFFLSLIIILLAKGHESIRANGLMITKIFVEIHVEIPCRKRYIVRSRLMNESSLANIANKAPRT